MNREDNAPPAPSKTVAAGWVDAIYRPAQLPEHRGNPLAEALPPYAEGTGPVELLANVPSYRDAERNESKSYRLVALTRIRVLLETMPWHSMVMDLIYRLIWSGYVFRNPLESRAQRISDNYTGVMQTGKPAPLASVAPPHASVCALLGGSGIGKTSVVRRVLSFLPQVIRHADHGIVQLVWLYVECPPGGSVNDLLQWIIEAADAVLDGGYVKKSLVRGDTYNTRLSVLKDILREHFVGLIVIDEIQNCLTKKVKSHEKFFTSFPNLHGTPILHVGLPSVLEQYPVELHAARRVSDDGVHELPACMDDDEWDLFIEELIRYQWTLEVATVAEIGATLKEESAAIPAIAARLFQLAQAEAIVGDISKITPALIKKVAQNNLLPLHIVLDAIRKGNARAVGNYDPQMKDVNKQMDANVDAVRDQRKDIAGVVKKEQVARAVRDAVNSLVTLGYPENQVYAFIARLSRDNPGGEAAWLTMQYFRDQERKKERGASLEQRVADEMKREHEEMNGSKAE